MKQYMFAIIVEWFLACAFVEAPYQQVGLNRAKSIYARNALKYIKILRLSVNFMKIRVNAIFVASERKDEE